MRVVARAVAELIHLRQQFFAGNKRVTVRRGVGQLVRFYFFLSLTSECKGARSRRAPIVSEKSHHPSLRQVCTQKNIILPLRKATAQFTFLPLRSLSTRGEALLKVIEKFYAAFIAVRHIRN